MPKNLWLKNIQLSILIQTIKNIIIKTKTTRNNTLNRSILDIDAQSCNIIDIAYAQYWLIHSPWSHTSKYLTAPGYIYYYL